jgi:thymidylate kinase
MKKIIVVAFDGLHRSGKSTQIELLQKDLLSKNIFSFVARGDGTRRGTGSSVFDYPSKWWRKHFNYFQQKHSLNEEIEKMNLKYQKLNREINHFKNNTIPNMMKKRKYPIGVLILDRCYVSRYFTMRNLLGEVSLEEAIYCHNPKTKKQVEVIIPVLTFVLHTSKDILLKRIIESIIDSHDMEFKTNIVQNYYSLFEKIIKELSAKNKIEIINSELTPDEISEYVNKKVEELLNE